MTVSLNLPQLRGQKFVQAAIAAALNRHGGGAEYAAKRWGNDCLAARLAPKGGIVAKVAVGAGSTSDSWGAALAADADSAVAEFFSAVRERSLIGRLTALRRVPTHTKVIATTSGFSAAWVGSGNAVPVSSAAFTSFYIRPLQVAALTVQTDELLRSANPESEAFIREDMIAALVKAIDAAFIDPGNAGTEDIMPSSVAHGAPVAAATGTVPERLRALIKVFPGNLERAVLIGSAENFAEISDPDTFPDLGVRGGSVLGIPALPCAGAGNNLILLDPAMVAYGGGEVEIRTSHEGTIEMSDAPVGSSTQPTGTTVVSLFQTDSVALMTEARLNWQASAPCAAVLPLAGGE